jgi:E3 ubiquitin-protein ligase RNF146
MYDQRTNDEIDQTFRRGDRRLEILIVGHLYIIDFENMHQYRLNDTQRRRRIKYDLISAPKKGVGGLKLDLRRLKFSFFSSSGIKSIDSILEIMNIIQKISKHLWYHL